MPIGSTLSQICKLVLQHHRREQHVVSFASSSRFALSGRNTDGVEMRANRLLHPAICFSSKCGARRGVTTSSLHTKAASPGIRTASLQVRTSSVRVTTLSRGVWSATLRVSSMALSDSRSSSKGGGRHRPGDRPHFKRDRLLALYFLLDVRSIKPEKNSGRL